MFIFRLSVYAFSLHKPFSTSRYMLSFVIIYSEALLRRTKQSYTGVTVCFHIYLYLFLHLHNGLAQPVLNLDTPCSRNIYPCVPSTMIGNYKGNMKRSVSEDVGLHAKLDTCLSYKATRFWVDVFTENRIWASITLLQHPRFVFLAWMSSTWKVWNVRDPRACHPNDLDKLGQR